MKVELPSLPGRCSDARLPVHLRLRVPWCTIRAAILAAPPGGTVTLRGGTYPFQSLHGLGRRSVTIEPAGYGTPHAQRVTIQGISTADTSHLRFRGLHLVGGDATGFRPAASVYLGSHHIQLVDDLMTGQGVYVQGASHVLIADSRIHSVTRNCRVNHIGDGGGIFVQRSRYVRILHNRIHGTLQDSLNVGAIPHLYVHGNDMSNAKRRLCGDHTDLVQIEGGRQGPMTFTDNVFHDGGQFILRNATGLTIARNLILRVNNWMQLEATPGAHVLDNIWWKGNRRCPGCGSLLIRDYGPRDDFARPPFNYTRHMKGTVIAHNVMRIFANTGVPRSAYREDRDVIYGVRSNSTGIEGAHTRAVPRSHRGHDKHHGEHGHARHRSGPARKLLRELVRNLRHHHVQPEIVRTALRIERRL